MQFRSHVKIAGGIGMIVVAAGSTVLGITWPADLIMAPAITAGAGDWPDIDHRKSMVTNFFPPITVPLHWFAVWTNRIIYACTRRRWDAPVRTGFRQTRYGRRRARRARKLWTLPSLFRHWHIPFIGHRRGWIDSHRMLWHSYTIAVITGVLWGVSVMAGPLWLAPLLIAFTVGLAGRVLFGGALLFCYTLAGLAHFGGAEGLLVHLQQMGWLWGLSVLVGMVAHIWSDECTTGVTAVWSPWSWKKVRFPTPPFDTGGWFENTLLPILIAIMLIAAGYYMFVSWWPHIVAMSH